MKKNLFIYLIIALAGLFYQGVLSAATVTVSMVDFKFQPDPVMINAGDSIVWKNNTVITPHTSTSGSNCTKDGKWDTGTISGGQSSQPIAFNNAGNFPYYCIFHCGLGMTGTVMVSGGTNTTTTVSGGTTTTTAASTTTTSVKGGFSLSKLFPIPPEVLLSEWPLANKNYRNTRASFDSIIDSRNASRLKVAWTFDIPGIGPFGAAATNPLIIGHRVYLQDLKSNVYTLNLRTGTMIWKKDYNVDNIGPIGLAAGWGKIFVPVQPNIVALDRRGNEVWRTKIAALDSEGIDCQLTVFDNLVYASTVPGSSVTNFYTGGAIGVIYALDQQTGNVAWSFDTVDTADIWGNPAVNSGGGAWYPPAIDLMTGMMYWGIANPAPFPGTADFPNGSSRPGLNLYTDSLLALDAKSGALSWYKQVLPHDILDHDFQCSPILSTATINGARKEIIIGGGKGGVVVAFDRANGDIIWKTPVGIHENDDLTELPEGTTRVYPGIFGGIETNMALAEGMVFVPVVNVFTDFTPTAIDQTNLDIAGGTGELVALDVNTGAVLWKKEFNSPNFGSATVVNDLVFTATFDGTIYAFNRRTGDQVWTYTASGGINAWPAVADDTIIFPVGLGNPPQLIAFKPGF
jgi:outer membrane protein assembly factor BamB